MSMTSSGAYSPTRHLRVIRRLTLRYARIMVQECLAIPSRANATYRADAFVPMAPTILVFDSGLGGLTVFREIAKARPDARYIFVADDAFFPYGSHGETELVERVGNLMEELIAFHRPDIVVIACNTASTLVLPHLRARFSVPFVGTVPAIKPACAGSVSKRVTVLGTLATVGREYTRALIRDFANGSDVTLVGSSELARFAEAELNGKPVADRLIAEQIAPCFVNDGARRTDTVVLACTHYPLLIERFERLALWPVRFIDPAPAIARRVLELSAPLTGAEPAIPACAVFTSGQLPSPSLTAALARFGIAPRAG
jgi:glutamate racemase